MSTKFGMPLGPIPPLRPYSASIDATRNESKIRNTLTSEPKLFLPEVCLTNGGIFVSPLLAKCDMTGPHLKFDLTEMQKEGKVVDWSVKTFETLKESVDGIFSLCGEKSRPKTVRAYLLAAMRYAAFMSMGQGDEYYIQLHQIFQLFSSIYHPDVAHLRMEFLLSPIGDMKIFGMYPITDMSVQTVVENLNRVTIPTQGSLPIVTPEIRDMVMRTSTSANVPLGNFDTQMVFLYMLSPNGIYFSGAYPISQNLIVDPTSLMTKATVANLRRRFGECSLATQFGKSLLEAFCSSNGDITAVAADAASPLARLIAPFAETVVVVFSSSQSGYELESVSQLGSAGGSPVLN